MNRLMLLGFLLATATAHSSGTLQLGEPTVEEDRITIPVIVGGDLGGGVSALDFRFRYNPEALQPVSVIAGPAAEMAGKRVMSNQRTPGEYSVVMMGFNQSACGPGEAVQIVLQRLQGPDQKWDLSLLDPTMSSMDGRLIESQVLPSDIEPADDSEPEEQESSRSTGLPAATDSNATRDEETASQPAPVYEAPIGEMAAAIVPEKTPVAVAADSVESSLELAGAAREGILSPESITPEGDEGSGREPGIASEDRSDRAGDSGQTDISGLAGAQLPAEALQENTVEPQSEANAAQPSTSRSHWGGSLKPALLGFIVVFAAAVAWFWRRSRLIG